MVALTRGGTRGLLRGQDRIDEELPGSPAHCGIACCQVSLGKLRIEGRLIVRFILGIEESQSFGAIRSAQAFLFAGGVVFDVKAAIARADTV